MCSRIGRSEGAEPCFKQGRSVGFELGPYSSDQSDQDGEREVLAAELLVLADHAVERSKHGEELPTFT